jgi:hypothetical protein
MAYGAETTTTDATGTYLFDNVLVGTVMVTANLAGYNEATQNVTVAQDATSTANFQLAPAVGTVKGRVTSINSGAALASATVQYSGGSTLTDTNGNYTFTSVAPGSKSFTASKSGYLSRSSTVAVTAGVATTLNFQLSTSGKIAGKVVTSTGAIISGATVKLSGGVIATSVTLTTNSTGNYLSGWIPVGSYTVTVSKSGFTTTNKSTSVSAGVTSTVNFTMQ